MKKIRSSSLNNNLDKENPNVIDRLYQKVSAHIENAREGVQRSVDTEMVKTYWLTGNDIIEEEQGGSERAEYGSFLIKELSERLSKTYGRGFGVATLKNARQFYLTYSNRPPIGYALRSQFENLSPKLG